MKKKYKFSMLDYFESNFLLGCDDDDLFDYYNNLSYQEKLDMCNADIKDDGFDNFDWDAEYEITEDYYFRNIKTGEIYNKPIQTHCPEEENPTQWDMMHEWAYEEIK